MDEVDTAVHHFSEVPQIIMEQIQTALYIVSTPIGNLSDMTFRAVDILKSVDLIAAEDTRHAQKLLQHYEIKTPATSFHSYTSEEKLEAIIRQILEGKSVALISDAGTPGISDPGWALIKKAIDQNIKVIPIPGASALLPALVASGLPTHHFIFYGFLPLKKGRKTLLQSWRHDNSDENSDNNSHENNHDNSRENHTIVFYESPHRIQRTLTELSDTFKDQFWTLVLARELTKIHEEFIRGDLHEIAKTFKNPRGEFVLMLHKNQEQSS